MAGRKSEKKRRRNWEIQQKHQKGVKLDDLAAEYELSKSTIAAIAGGFAQYSIIESEPEPVDSELTICGNVVQDEDEPEDGAGISEWIDDEGDTRSAASLERVLDKKPEAHNQERRGCGEL